MNLEGICRVEETEGHMLGVGGDRAMAVGPKTRTQDPTQEGFVLQPVLPAVLPAYGTTILISPYDARVATAL